MLDFARITGFDWDDGNAEKNHKHGVSQVEAEQVFFNRPILLVSDHAHRDSEQRVHAMGVTDSGRKLHVTFTIRKEGTLIRVISARDMNKNERRAYEQESA